MKKFLNRFKAAFHPPKKEIEWPPVDINREVRQIQTVEKEEKPGLGIRIHAFDFHEFALSLDRDITGHYRLSVFDGQEKRYSFSIMSADNDYDSLTNAFETILAYLGGDRRLANLPKTDLIRGHFFGPLGQ